MAHNRRRGASARWPLWLAAAVLLAVAAWLLWPQAGGGTLPARFGLERDAPATTLALQLPATGPEPATIARPPLPALDGGRRSAAEPEPAAPWLDDSAPADPEQPVTELLERLLDRARAGEPLASCELGRALGECATYLLNSRVSELPPLASGAPHPLQAWRTRMERRCGGIGVDDLALAPALLARAAQAGHVPSLLDFLDAPGRYAAEFLLDAELGSFYRSQAWPLLRRAVAAGHADAGLRLMQQIASGHRTPLVVLLPEGYRDPLAARAVLADMGRGMPAALRPAYPPPSERSAATVGRWVDELFGGAVPSVDTRTPFHEPGTVVPSQCRDAAAWAPR
jgi:hypothetical protein